MGLLKILRDIFRGFRGLEHRCQQFSTELGQTGRIQPIRPDPEPIIMLTQIFIMLTQLFNK